MGSVPNGTDLYWLAGLLEGEGSFLAGPPSNPNCPRAQLAMTDQDVVERAAQLFGRRVWRSDRGRDRGYKPAFLTAIKGAAAARLMTTLRPIMGDRRQAQIDHALARPHVRTVRWHVHATACSVPTCPRPVRTKGLCKLHYHLWWKARKRGRPSKYIPLDAPLPPAIDDATIITQPDPDTRAALAWLAGLLEGEGSFDALRHRDHHYPRISVSMCDEDVIGRARAILGSRSVWRDEPRQDGWSAMFATALTGARAADAMNTLLPFMGRRRASEIASALAAYQPIRVARRSGCTVPGCEQPHDSRGLCHRHHMQWWRDVRHGRVPRVAALR